MKLMFVVGARPNFVKLAPVLRELGRRKFSDYLVVHTGQHYDEYMSGVFFEELRIPLPAINLGVEAGSHVQQISSIMGKLESMVDIHKPDTVVVFGDVNSTLAAALVAVRTGCRLAHVEAGLRCFDRTMPEEQNRVIADWLSDVCFAPTPQAIQNLKFEGCKGERHLVGNVMIDNLKLALSRAKGVVSKEDYALVTLHRAATVDDPKSLREVLQALAEIQDRVKLVFPVHPRTQKRIREYGLTDPYKVLVGIMDPVGYLELVSLMQDALFVLTDSGGMQVETSYLEVPCLTLRESTEHWDTLATGTNILVGTNRARILAEVDAVLRGKRKDTVPSELNDGKASERIVDILMEML